MTTTSRSNVHKDIEVKYNKWKAEIKKMSNYDAYDYTNSTWTDITIADHVTNNRALKVDGTLEVQGRDVLEELDQMRDALLLLKRDVDMESKYPKLKELKDAYEAQLEKYKTFETIKESK